MSYSQLIRVDAERTMETDTLCLVVLPILTSTERGGRIEGQRPPIHTFKTFYSFLVNYHQSSFVCLFKAV